MATAAHVAAGKDDVSYSHTLKKLLRVNVEKGPGGGEASRQLGRTMGQTGVSLNSVVSRYDQSVAAGPTDSLARQQSRRAASPTASPVGGPAGRRPGSLRPPGTLGAAPPGTPGSKAARRATSYQPPEPPASFMRTSFSAPSSTRRRQQRRSVTSESAASNGSGTSGNGNGNGNHQAAAAGSRHTTSGPATFLPGEKSGGFSAVLTTAGASHGGGGGGGVSSAPPVLRLASLTAGLAPGAAAAAATGNDDGAGAGSPVGAAAAAAAVTWNPYLLSPRRRMHSGGVSNMSYKPVGSATAEQAAAVLQRRRAAMAAGRNGEVSPFGAASGGSFFFGPGGMATAAAAAAAGGGGGGLRSSWDSPTGPSSIQLLSLGLGSSSELEDGGGGAKPRDGSDAGGVSGPLGLFGEDGAGGGSGGGVGNSGVVVSYDSLWPLTNWRALGATADGDADAVRTDGPAAEAAGLGFYLRRPVTSPVVSPALRRSGGAAVSVGAAAAAADGGGRPSPFAPPQQLYMKAGDDSDDGPGGPVATVATAAAKAGRLLPPSPPASPLTAGSTERPTTRIPNLDLALLRSAVSAPSAASTAAAGGGGGAAAAAAAAAVTAAAARPNALTRCDSDLGQSALMGVEGEGGGGDGAAAATAATTPVRQYGEPARPPTRSGPLPSTPCNNAGTPVGAVGGSIFKGGLTPEKGTAAPSGGGGAPPAAVGGAAAVVSGIGDGSGGTAGDGGLTEAQLRARRRSSARGGFASSIDGEPSAAAASGPYVMGDTTKMLQVGVSVAALLEVVKALPPSQRFASTADVFRQWLMPPTQNSQCRFLDLVMARVKIILGEQPEAVPLSAPAAVIDAAIAGGRGGGVGGGSSPPSHPRGSCSGTPILHPDRTWFGPPDYYVIHAWRGNFMALVAALREYCVILNKTPSSTYVWLDIMAVNHHPGRKDRKELSHAKQIMATARKALLVLDPMADCLTRLWCLYEIWLAACAGSGAGASKLTLLNAGADWDAFADSFFRIDLSRCATSNADDRAKLLEDMIRTSHDAGSGSGGLGGGGRGGGGPPASGSTISPYGVVAALPQLSVAVRAALFDAAASDVAEARRGARVGGGGMLALLDAIERYAMIRRLAGGHVEAEEQLEAAVAAAMGVSGGRAPASARPLSPATKSTGSGGGAAAAASADFAASGAAGRLEPSPALTDGGGGDAAAAGDGGAERPPTMPSVILPPIHLSHHASSTVTASGGGGAAPAAAVAAAAATNNFRPISPAYDDDGLALAAAAAAAAAALAAAGGGAYAASSAAAWRKKPATLAALAFLEAEHGRLLQASTHAAMALSCVPGLALVRPAVPPGASDGDGDDNGHSNGNNRHNKGGNHHGGGVGGVSRQRSGSPPPLHSLPSNRARQVTYDNGVSGSGGVGGGGGSGSGGGEHDRRHYGGQHASSFRGGGGGGGEASKAPPGPGEIAWKGSYWELTSPQNVTADATRAIFLASVVEAACGRHEAAAQLALQAGLARAAALGSAHPATLATRRAAVSHLVSLGRLAEAGLLAKSLLREALAEHGDVHPSVGVCHCAVAMVLAAQNKAEVAYSSAQRGAEVLAACLGRGHPATLEALQLCADMLEAAREYGKAVALMRLVVQGRSVPGAIRASPASPAFLAPNNRLLHLRTIAALEEKAMSEEHSRRAMLSVLRSLARLESELRAALTAMTGAPAATQALIQRDLELVLMSQNKRYEAAMLRKGELRPT